MNLPPQEKNYTIDDVNHMVAREVAKQRMSDLERNLQQTNDQVVKMWAKFDASFEAIKLAIEGQEDNWRKEMERDFATKMDLERLDAKVDKVWLKVSLPVATVVGLVQWIVTFWPTR